MRARAYKHVFGADLAAVRQVGDLFRRKHLLEFCCSLASLRGMRLIGDDGKRLAFGGRQLADLFEREGKCLDGADDDLLARCQRLRKLSAFARPSDLIGGHHPVVRWKSNSASWSCDRSRFGQR